MNICMCGTQNGYLHAVDCPFPYFGQSESLQKIWLRDREILRESKKEDIELPLEDYLDSYSIALFMGMAARKLKAKVKQVIVTHAPEDVV